MKKYRVLTGDSESELADAVTDMLAEDWQLVGGVSVAVVKYRDQDNFQMFDFTFAQAVVRDDEAES